MKKLIVLPGNSVKNKAWADDVATRFGGLVNATYVQYYDHWESGEEAINFDREAEKLQQEVANDAPGTEYYIFAKSFGSILALLSVHRGYVIPAKCVFFGIPLNLVAEQNIFQGDWAFVSTFSVPAIAFHNDRDPVADYTFTTNKLQELGVDSIELLEMSGDTHAYTELELYEERIKSEFPKER